MKKILCLFCAAGFVFAADKMVMLNINDAINSPLGKEHLLKDVSLNFSGGGHVIKKGVVANRKTNGFSKDKNLSCERAIISSLRALQDAAIKAGAKKVVNIRSYYKKNELKEPRVYECAQGKLMVGVTLKADLAK